MQIGVRDSRFTIEGEPCFLLGAAYLGALGAPDEFVLWDLSELRELGFNWLRVSATWSAFGDNVSAVTASGEPREPYLTRLRRLCATTAELGIVLGLSFGVGQAEDALGGVEVPVSAIATLTQELAPFRHLYFELCHSTDSPGGRGWVEELGRLRQRCRMLDAGRLVALTLVGGGGELLAQVREVAADAFLLRPARPGNRPEETRQGLTTDARQLRETARPVPLLLCQARRRGIDAPAPTVDECLADLRRAYGARAAGWCFENGPDVARPDGRPRRCHDMRPTEGRLFDQLEPEELQVLEQAAAITGG